MGRYARTSKDSTTRSASWKSYWPWIASAEFLRLMSEGLQKQDDRLAVLDAYLQLVDLQYGQGEPESVETNLSVRRDRWLQARFDELYAAATSDERSKIDVAIATRLKTATDAKTTKALRKFLGYFGNLPVADECGSGLLCQHSARFAVGARRTAPTTRYGEGPDAATGCRGPTGMLLLSASRPDEAAVYYHRLATEWANVVCLGGKTGKQLVADLPPDSPGARALAESEPWPSGQVKREASGPQLRGINYQRPQVLEWHGDHGVLGTTTVLFDQQQQQVVGRDGMGREQFRIPLAESGQQNRMGFIQPSAPNLKFRYRASTYCWSTWEIKCWPWIRFVPRAAAAVCSGRRSCWKCRRTCSTSLRCNRGRSAFPSRRRAICLP